MTNFQRTPNFHEIHILQTEQKNSSNHRSRHNFHIRYCIIYRKYKAVWFFRYSKTRRKILRVKAFFSFWHLFFSSEKVCKFSIQNSENCASSIEKVLHRIYPAQGPAQGQNNYLPVNGSASILQNKPSKVRRKITLVVSLTRFWGNVSGEISREKGRVSQKDFYLRVNLFEAKLCVFTIFFWEFDLTT